MIQVLLARQLTGLAKAAKAAKGGRLVAGLAMAVVLAGSLAACATDSLQVVPESAEPEQTSKAFSGNQESSLSRRPPLPERVAGQPDAPVADDDSTTPPVASHQVQDPPPEPRLMMPPVAATDSVIERGGASWYGPRFHGRRTANGERYDMNGLTAAHRTLAFGTVVRVRSLVNGREVEVRINDRGPFSRQRIIDLSQAAARELDMLGLGVKNVVLLERKTGLPAFSLSRPALPAPDDETLLGGTGKTGHPIQHTPDLLRN